MSVRWQHFIDHADTKQKPANVTRLSSRRSSAADRQSVKRDYSEHGSDARLRNNVLVLYCAPAGATDNLQYRDFNKFHLLQLNEANLANQYFYFTTLV